jgi:hypothetical protein
VRPTDRSKFLVCHKNSKEYGPFSQRIAIELADKANQREKAVSTSTTQKQESTERGRFDQKPPCEWTGDKRRRWWKYVDLGERTGIPQPMSPDDPLQSDPLLLALRAIADGLSAKEAFKRLTPATDFTTDIPSDSEQVDRQQSPLKHDTGGVGRT